MVLRKGSMNGNDFKEILEQVGLKPETDLQETMVYEAMQRVANQTAVEIFIASTGDSKPEIPSKEVVLAEFHEWWDSNYVFDEDRPVYVVIHTWEVIDAYFRQLNLAPIYKEAQGAI
jgi:hypothetical protein